MMRRYYTKIIAGENARAKSLGIPGIFIIDEWIALCEQYGNICLRCGVMDVLTPDHVLPLTKKGRNDIGNIQPLCWPCNHRKATTHTDFRSESREVRLSRWRKIRMLGVLSTLSKSERTLSWPSLATDKMISVLVEEHAFHVRIDGFIDKRVKKLVPLSSELQKQYEQHEIVATVANVGLTALRRDTLLSMQTRLQQYLSEQVDTSLNAYLEALETGDHVMIIFQARKHAEQIGTNFSFF